MNKNIAIVFLTGVLALGAGLALQYFADEPEPAAVSLDTPAVRVYDEELQLFGGTGWRSVASVLKLAEEYPFAAEQAAKEQPAEQPPEGVRRAAGRAPSESHRSSQEQGAASIEAPKAPVIYSDSSGGSGGGSSSGGSSGDSGGSSGSAAPSSGDGGDISAGDL